MTRERFAAVLPRRVEDAASAVPRRDAAGRIGDPLAEAEAPDAPAARVTFTAVEARGMDLLVDGIAEVLAAGPRVGAAGARDPFPLFVARQRPAERAERTQRVL